MLKKFQIVDKLHTSSRKRGHISIKMVTSNIFYILFCALFLNVAQGISVNECTQGGLVPEEVIVDNCQQDVDICPVKFNGRFNMTMKFKAPHYLESMKPNLIVRTAFGNTTVVGESCNDDVCSGILNTICPIVEKEVIEYKYSAKLLVLPLIPITLEFSILDKDLNETAVCFTVVVSPSKL